MQFQLPSCNGFGAEGFQGFFPEGHESIPYSLTRLFVNSPGYTGSFNEDNCVQSNCFPLICFSKCNIVSFPAVRAGIGWFIAPIEMVWLM